MRLGKQDPQRDARNFQLRAVMLDSQPALPTTFDVDDLYGARRLIANPMFANDVYGCCVIAGRAHQTRRMELADQGGLITIDEQVVIDEYLLESGGQDTGLIVLPSLKAWRLGWKAWHPAQAIQSFVEVTPTDRDAVKAAIVGACGIGLGFGMPLTADQQFRAGQPWELVSWGTAMSKPYSWGGHYVYALGYNMDWVTCITWGKRQRMSWEFLEKYADEAYAVTDAKTPSYGVLDAAKISNHIAARTQ